MNRGACVEWKSSTPRARQVALWLAVLAMICTIAVVLGSFDFRTTRTWRLGPGTGQGQEDGAAQWAGWTLLAGVPALGALAISTVALARAPHARTGDKRRTAGAFALLAALLLGVAGTVSGINWMRLIAEQQRVAEHTLTITQGLQVALVASVVGAGLAVSVFLLALDSR